ncbi:MAG: CDP-alcohol phosphatidyltransferase family protein [Thermodesulfobacteriota bacterium]
MPTLPDLLSIFRIVAAPFLLLAAWSGLHGPFLLLFVAALISDALDGFLARRLGQTTALGGQLDSWGDFALYCTTPLAVWWLWPEVILHELPCVAAAILSFLLPVAAGFVKFRRLTSYHTWGAKAAAVALGIATPLLLLGGPAWPFRLAVFLLALSAVDECIITLLLPRWQADIPSCLHARRLGQRGH